MVFDYTVANLASEWNWLLLSVGFSASWLGLGLGHPCTTPAFHSPTQVPFLLAVALFQHPSSCPLSAWMLGGSHSFAASPSGYLLLGTCELNAQRVFSNSLSTGWCMRDLALGWRKAPTSGFGGDLWGTQTQQLHGKLVVCKVM